MKIDVEAALVGQAADVLSDPDLRLDSSLIVKCRDGRWVGRMAAVVGIDEEVLDRHMG